MKPRGPALFGDNIDNFIPNSLMSQLTSTLNIVTQLSLIWVEALWVLCSVPLLLAHLGIFWLIRKPNRDTRRLEAAAHSPVYGHFGDTLCGRETIRAFNVEANFIHENMRLVYDMSMAKYGNQAVSKWAQAMTTQWSCVFIV